MIKVCLYIFHNNEVTQRQISHLLKTMLLNKLIDNDLDNERSTEES